MSKDTSTHFQDSGHNEGQVANTPPQGQPREGNNPQSMSTNDQKEQGGRNKEAERNVDTVGNP